MEAVGAGAQNRAEPLAGALADLLAQRLRAGFGAVEADAAPVGQRQRLQVGSVAARMFAHRRARLGVAQAAGMPADAVQLREFRAMPFGGRRQILAEP